MHVLLVEDDKAAAAYLTKGLTESGHVVDDRVQGLHAGGDDYLAKPYAFSELLARLDALARRSRPAAEAPQSLRVADLELDLTLHRVTRAGRPSKLHLLLADAGGLPLAGDLKDWPPGLPPDDQVHNVQIEDELIAGRSEDEDAYWPALARRLPNGHRLLVAHGLDQAEALLDFTQGTMLAILAVSIALALGLALLQGRALLARIDALIDTARSIGAGRLSRRIPLSGKGVDLDEIIRTFNALIEIAQAEAGSFRGAKWPD